MHSCLVCIGSNYHRKENLLLARRRLQELYPSVRFTSEQDTLPLFFQQNKALFTNQMAFFFSDQGEEEVVGELKSIERAAGRRPEDKAREIICLDIDLLSFDGRILKPEDLKREYVAKALQELTLLSQ